MAEVAASAGRQPTISDQSDRISGFDLRDEIAALYQQHYERTCRYDQLDGLEQVARWYLRTVHREGERVHRSWAQAARGIGWTADTRRQTVDRHRNSIRRRLEVLRVIGWIERYEPVYRPDGESTGILIVASPAGVAQSVGASAYRWRSGRPRGACQGERGGGRASKSRQVSTPLRDQQRRAQASVISERKSERARARAHEGGFATQERRDRERWGRQRGAALEALRRRVASRDGCEALEALRRPGVTDDPLAIGIAAFELVAPGEHPKLTTKRKNHLFRYCRILDRLEGAGAGAALLVDLIAEQPDTGRSLSFYVCLLRTEVRARRRAARGKPPLRRGLPSWWEKWLEGRRGSENVHEPVYQRSWRGFAASSTVKTAGSAIGALLEGLAPR